MDSLEQQDENRGIDRRTLLQTAGTLALSGGLLAACGGTSSSQSSGGTSTGTGTTTSATGAPKRGGIAKIAVTSGSSRDTLDPAVWDNQMEQTALGSMYESLVDVDEQTWVPKPLLAEAWHVSPDATEWSFKIRSGIEFHDGRPLTAQDAAYSLKRVLNSKLGSPLSGRLGGNSILRASPPRTRRPFA